MLQILHTLQIHCKGAWVRFSKQLNLCMITHQELPSVEPHILLNQIMSIFDCLRITYFKLKSVLSIIINGNNDVRCPFLFYFETAHRIE